MENLITRYRNVTVLVAVLFVQVLVLAVQVKRKSENDSSRLIRIWAVSAVTPFEKSIVWFENGTAGLWHNYLYLRGVRQENRDLKATIERLRLEQVRLREDAEQARRLQLLLSFKEQYISETIAAQVIGSSGSEQSRTVYIDKGTRDGIKPDMAVITADGVIGKVLRVYGGKPGEASVSQILLIDDQSSGVGAILEKSRLQGILRGTPSGEVMLEKVMADEVVQPGEKVLTSGGDLVFPKGMPVGTVSSVSKGPESFLNIRIKPTADLSKLEEVLVITKSEEKNPVMTEQGSARAVDILAQRLPSVPDKPADDPTKPPPPTSGLTIAPAPTKSAAAGTAQKTQPGGQVAGGSKPATDGTAKPPAVAVKQQGTISVAPQTKTAVPAATGAITVKPPATPKAAPKTINVSDPLTSAAGNKATAVPSTNKPAAKPLAAPAKPTEVSPEKPAPAPEDKPQ